MLPNIIPSDVRTGWMQFTSDRRLEINHSFNTSNNNNNANNNTGIRSRTSDFPPLSFYTPIKSNPLHINNSLKHALSFLQNSKKSSCNKNHYTGNNHDTSFEGIEQLELELGYRLQMLKDNETWGYTWLRPLGLDKTMAQMLEDVNEDDDIEDDNLNHNIPNEAEINDNINVNNNNNNNNNPVAAITNDNINDPISNQQNETRDDTDMMTENYGQMRRNENNESISYNNNEINSRISNENSENRVIYDNSAEGRLFSERDLDAEISNHDISNNSEIYRENNQYYEDENDGNDNNDDVDDVDDEDGLGDHAYIHEEDDPEEYEDEDGDDGFEIGNNFIMDLQDDYEDDNYEHVGNNLNSRSLLQSSFYEDTDRREGVISNAYSNRAYLEGEERYFMAYEEYQDDHSVLEGQSGKPYPRTASIPDSAQTRRSNNSIRRNLITNYIDSANLTTPTTLNSNIANQSTGQTSMDNGIHGLDFDLNLE
ncbi:hypothetical protein C6P40_005434 [Pichia californica]|uniref:Uncharacterized protein n=1 Tax=Pichia californica TaxID=460514 RepID=A0A9P6WLP4_9ASCO|nr:hypothetical protein C6P40_005434 [[Candida] californica]